MAFSFPLDRSAYGSFLVGGLLALLLGGLALPAPAQDPAPISTEALSSLEFREIGPAVTGGRIHDIEARPDDPSTIYAATASGGLWKTTNRGTTWDSIFEDPPVSTFGDVALAPSNPEVVWAGTGEQNNRQSTSWGNGVYRSTDAGSTWTHLGLEDTRHIGRVRVHPADPDVAYVAAQGNLWAPSEARGVYRTTDGGETWDKVLYVDRHTGAVDLVMDPDNPDVLYAATYQRLRRTWGFNGGGAGSGIHKTTDGGDTWTELTDGLPAGDKGRIGLAIAETNPDVLYATVEHADAGGTYRTRDAGASWTKVNDLNPRPMYYSHVFVDPTDADRVFVLSTEFYMSENAGETFTQMPTRPSYDVGVHSDHHTLWVDPSNPEHFYLAGDAGLHETWDRGETYRRINNLPIGQFYAIGLDNRTPYNIYGGMQDNHSWMAPSETRRWKGIIDDDWRQIGFGDGTYQQVANSRAVFVGSQNGGLQRVDPVTGDNMTVEPIEPDDADYRFDWVTPSHVSRHDSSTVYFGGNRLFISRDTGATWTRTEDLTKDVDRETLSLMGVPGSEDMLSKHDGTASYGEITTIAESPLTPDVLWVGTDDGNVQVSRDGGDTWTEVGANITSVNDTTYVSRVIASAAGEGVAYVTLDGHRDGDFAPYVFETTDFGQTWTAQTDGLPDEGTVNVIVEHPDNPNTLFLGTEHALFASTTAGDQWTKVESGLPTTLYDDLKIHPREKDLVVGTHGRGIWILDDTTPIAEWSASAKTADAHLFSIRPATIENFWKNTSYRGQASWAGENPPLGAPISYHLGAPADSVTLVVRNPDDEVVRRLDGPASTGQIHRVTWDLTHPPPPTEADEDGEDEDSGVVEPDTILPELEYPTDPKGPFVRPGTYTVTLRAGDATATEPVEVRGDPAIEMTAEQWRARESFLVDLLDAQRRAFQASRRADSLHERLQTRRENVEGGGPDDLQALVDSAESHSDELTDLRDDLDGLAGGFNWSGVTQPSLRAPTPTHRDRKERLEARLQDAIEQFRAFEQTAMAAR
jgi:photosystem II stability/assembly factor-like uncharacterized protein